MLMRRAFVLLGLVGIIASTGTAAPGAQAGQRGAAAAARSGNVEHGRYIVESVAMCFECHSPRDARGNLIETERYMGGLIPFAPPWPNDWATRAPRNKGLPGYDDALAMRLLTEGSIGRNGAQLKRPMPRFHMTPQDAADVIAFLRSLP
jgi:mono/diheme cytochrome c family protein